MNKERSQIPCVINPEKICDCPLRSLNAEYVNYAGKKDRGIRSAIQRQGYDHVSPGLIKELLTHPQGGYYTEAFNMVFEFSPVKSSSAFAVSSAYFSNVFILSA